jgi:hypothetical protein
MVQRGSCGKSEHFWVAWTTFCPGARERHRERTGGRRTIPLNPDGESSLVPKLHLGTRLSAQLCCRGRVEVPSWIGNGIASASAFQMELMEFGNEGKRFPQAHHSRGMAESSPAIHRRVSRCKGSRPSGTPERKTERRNSDQASRWDAAHPGPNPGDESPGYSRPSLQDLHVPIPVPVPWNGCGRSLGTRGKLAHALRFEKQIRLLF